MLHISLQAMNKLFTLRLFYPTLKSSLDVVYSIQNIKKRRFTSKAVNAIKKGDFPVDIANIIKKISKPAPYVKGTHSMWTDSHISKFLLDAHIDPNSAAASRTPENIENTVEIIDRMVRPASEILDLGCGPGLYTQLLAKKGHKVTGVDFSKRSIDYAREQRNKSLLEIKYIHNNYLHLNFESKFDFIYMNYCDFGVLIPEERTHLLKMIWKGLKPGGTFLFDAIDEQTIERLDFHSSWEMERSGFWKPDPYICLNEKIHFPENKATLDQHIVIGEDDSFQLYRFWNHYFNQDDVETLFLPAGFSKVESIYHVLTGTSPFNDDGVVFYSVTK